MSKLTKKEKIAVNNALREVAREFSYDGTGWDLNDVEAVKQKKRAELAGAMVRQFWNENKGDIIANFNQGQGDKDVEK